MCSCCESPGCKAQIGVQADCLAAASANAERAERKLADAHARIAALEAQVAALALDLAHVTVALRRFYESGIAEADIVASAEHTLRTLAHDSQHLAALDAARRKVCAAAMGVDEAFRRNDKAGHAAWLTRLRAALDALRIAEEM